MKRLLCIISSLTAGGAETFLMKVSRVLPPEKYQFDFIVTSEEGCYTKEVLARGGRIFLIPLRTKNPIRALTCIAKIVRDNHYDFVLKLGDTPIAALDLIAARLGGAKYPSIRSCNARTDLSAKKKIISAILRPVLNGVAASKLAPSMLAAEFTFGKQHAHKDVCILHNGVDLSVFRYTPEGRERIRKEFSLSDKLVIGHIGRFHNQKNHEYLLKVFQKIRAKRKDAVLLLIGTGEKEHQIRSWVQELGLESDVIFAGTRMDIPDLLSAMDVFVFPSFYEGMPNTVIEAQATGLPCVIADTITADANITGLVQFLSLDASPEMWAQKALAVITAERWDTEPDFLAHHYDIQSVARDFTGIIFAEAKE